MNYKGYAMKMDLTPAASGLLIILMSFPFFLTGWDTGFTYWVAIGISYLIRNGLTLPVPPAADGQSKEK
jgi:hypothetical protein